MKRYVVWTWTFGFFTQIFSSVDALQLAQHFHKPINTAANDLGICATVLKKICRRHGILRWPSRKVTKFSTIQESHRVKTFSNKRLLHQLNSLKKKVARLESQLETTAKEDTRKRELLTKSIQEAKLEASNSLIVIRV